MKLWSGNNIINKEGMYYHGLCKSLPLYTENGNRSIKEAIFFGLSCFKLLKEDFDVMDCCGFPYFSLFSAKLACLIKGKRLYSTCHEVWGKENWKKYLGWKGIFGYWIEKLASKLPNKIISVSNDTTKRLVDKLNFSKEKITTIPNGIEFNKIQSITSAEEKSDIIFAGRLISHKNVNLLINSIKILAEKNPKIKVIIIGDGPERQNLENLSKNLKLEKNIAFKGFLKDEKEVYSLIKSSKAFVLPSSREGFGIVVIEANACGIPVIVINHKDNASKDLIKEGKNGFKAEFNEFSLVDNIIKAIKLSKGMKKECINSAKKYDWDNLINQFEEVYK